MTARLLELCGYTPAEIDASLAEVNTAFDKLGLTEQDVARARERITRYYQPELEGMRKVMGVYMRELVDLVLASEKGKDRILYASIPTACAEIIGAAALHSDKVHAAFPDALFDYTLGGFFDKLAPILEAAERHFLRPGVAHCGLIKLRLGLLLTERIPKPSLLVCMGNICDEAPKSDESMSIYFDFPVHYINLTQDWSGPEDSDREREFLAREIRNCARRVGEIVGFDVTEQMVAESRRLKQKIVDGVEKVNSLVLNADPVPVKSAAMDLVRFLKSLPMGRANLEAATEAANTVYDELKERVERGEGALPKGAPRVIIGLGAPLPDPTFTDLVEDMGLVIATNEAQVYHPDGALSPEPISQDGKDTWELYAHAVAGRSLSAGPARRVRAVAGACKRFHLDGVLWFYHFACRALATDALMVKHGVEREVGVPVLVLEGDSYDPRYYTSGQLRTRIEAFAEMLKAGKAAAAAS